MTMRDGYLATIMQHKEEDTVQKSMDKEQRATKLTPTGKALLLVELIVT